MLLDMTGISTHTVFIRLFPPGRTGRSNTEHFNMDTVGLCLSGRKGRPLWALDGTQCPQTSAPLWPWNTFQGASKPTCPTRQRHARLWFALLRCTQVGLLAPAA